MAKIEIFNSADNISCILCGDRVVALKTAIETHCDFCGKIKHTTHQCESSHFLCDDCYNIPVNEMIKLKCLKYKGINPIELAIDIMNSPSVKMHGTEHHFIVPAVLLTCVNNMKEKPENIAEKLDIAEERAMAETPDVCRFHDGFCGAAIGTGVFLSMFLDREHIHDDAWSLNNQIISETLKRIKEHGGPRCCKRDTYFSLLTSIEYLNEHFAFELNQSEPKCTFSLRNKSCGLEQCIFYNMTNSLV